MVFRIFVLFFALLVISLLLSYNLPPAFCCSGGGDNISRPAFLFDPEVTNTPQWAPLYLTLNQYYNDAWQEDSVVLGDNIKEWNQYFGGKLPTADIKYVIYKADITPLFDLQVKWKFKQFQLHPALDTNRLIQRLVIKPDPEFLRYILFAKTIEPFVSPRDYWSEGADTSDNTEKMIALAKQGEKYYRSCKSRFMKLRYGYQVVRLYRYVEDWEACITSYDKLVSPLKVKSIISYWALEQKAGALYKLDQYGEAAYLYSKIFAECPSRRNTSYASFSITIDSVWNDCMNRCKTPKEKTTMFFLRGINPYNSAFYEMKNILSIDPSSEYLIVLLSREINRIENEIFHSDGYLRDYADISGENVFHSLDSANFRDISQFVDSCITQKRIASPDVWKLAQSYLCFLGGDKIIARSMLADLEKNVQMECVRNAISRFEIFYDLTALNKIDDSTEDTFFTRVKAEEHKKLQDFTVAEFKQLYLLQHDTIKAYLCDNGLNNMVELLDLGLTNDILMWWNKDKRSSFDQFLVDNRFNNMNENYYEESKAKGLHGLLELKGALLLGQNKLADAYEVFKQIPESEQWKSNTDPFSSRINDCIMCDEDMKSQNTYNHLSLVKELMMYEQKLKSDPQHAAEYHYLLGNAYYNITYFGNAGEALTFQRNNSRMSYFGEKKYAKEWKSKPDMDCSRAQLHYVEAMKLAETAGNPEFAAECCFMAAKCEQNKYYIMVQSDDENHTTKNLHYKTFSNK